MKNTSFNYAKGSLSSFVRWVDITPPDEDACPTPKGVKGKLTVTSACLIILFVANFKINIDTN